MKPAQFDSLPILVQATRKQFPNRTAITFKEVDFTYLDIDRDVNRIAAKLIEAGMRRGDLVALHVERSVNMLVAMLAIHRVGAAYVPLDPAYPRERQNYIVRDSGLQCLVYDQVLNIDEPVRHCIDLSGAWFRASDAVEPVEAVPVAYEDVAYVIYTSGSTGRPKGVKVHHGAVANFLHSMRARPGMGASDTLLAVTTPSFDISVLELFLPLLVGGKIVLASRDEVADGGRLAELIEQHAVTVMQATPATWRMLFIAGWRGAPGLKALCGGEALDTALANQLLQATGSLWNMYGPTETTVWSTCHRVAPGEQPIPAGAPIDNTTLHVLGPQLDPVEDGETGELYIGGAGVALGYTDDALTRARFLKDPFSHDPQARLYRTGDLAYRTADGTLVLKGRADDQVKVKGFRIELNDVQENLLQIAGVEQAAVIAATNADGVTSLAGFVVPSRDRHVTPESIKAALAARVPEYMIPAKLLLVRSLPLTPNGKIDRASLKALRLEDDTAGDPDTLVYETRKELIVKIVQHLLGEKTVATDVSLFDLGLDSLQANRLVAMLAKHSGIKVSVAALFEHPTLDGFHAYVEQRAAADASGAAAPKSAPRRRKRRAGADDERIAVIGMAGRFPGADSVGQLWDILASGRDTITRFSRAEDDPGITGDIANNENYVRARGMIKGADLFDASHFGISPNDAIVMDPQQRVFLEVAWEAMESAGYDADRFDGLVGVYAGMGNNFYYHYNVSTHPDLIEMVGEVQVEVGREKDHIATLVSHKLNLTGPSLSINTACSTGLVAIDSAVHSLLSHQCDMALAGAIELRTPQMSGQVHEPGGIFTRDGKCRPFSDDASGTMFSDGAGAVVLKRLSDAIADGDVIHGVIIGSAVNHDGMHKKSYLAPSIQGQMDVIATAQERAEISPESITYMEAHGTATPVGDPIEFEALKNVFEAGTAKKNFCALGSVKGNLGHPTTAAGVVGLIKVCLALTNRKIPPLVNFSRINPNIDIENSPFYVNTDLRDWPAGPAPRRAAISSFGFCGTNAHLIVEEAPSRPIAAEEPCNRPYTLLPYSASSESALKALASRVQAQAAHAAADIGYTLAVGRRRLRHRGFGILDRENRHADERFTPDTQYVIRRGANRTAKPKLVFAFPGQGSQYVDMGSNLYRQEPAFRAALDECAAILRKHLGEDIRSVLFPSAGVDPDAFQARLNNTRFTQPAVFCVEYALAKTLMSWGLEAESFVGHSIGEFVAATLAGVFSLPDALELIAARGRLMSELPEGGMLSVRLPHEQLAGDLDASLSIAAINGPGLCVAAGPRDRIDALKQTLDERGVRSQLLHTSHAFHSSMMDAAVEPFLEIVRRMELHAPRIPIVSTATGQPMTDHDATSPLYWANHLRLPVRFAEAVGTLCMEDNVVLLEVGPRTTLCSLASMQFKRESRQFAISTLNDSARDDEEALSLARALGHLWLAGFELDWQAYYGRASRRVELPAYPFERKRYWIDPAQTRPAGERHAGQPTPSAADAEACLPPAIRETPGKRPATSKAGLLGELKRILESISGESYDDVSPAASLFELGLDSLLLTPLTYKLKEMFGVTVTFRQLLSDLSTLESIVDHIGEHAAVKPADANQPSASSGSSGNSDADGLELQPAQRIVFERSMRSTAASLAHHESATVMLTGPVDKDALVRAIHDLPVRHDALRATFGGDPARMSIAAEPATSAAIRWIEGRGQALDAIVEEDARTPFSLDAGPLVRFSVVTLGDARLAVLIAAHAAVCDGWSLDVLIEQLAKRYNANLSAKPDTAATPSQWRDYMAQRLAADADGAQAAHARREPPSSDIGAAATHDNAGPAADAFESIHRTIGISPPQAQQIRAASTKHQCSPFTLLLAAAQLALASWRDRQPSAIDIPIAGQSLHNLPTLVGQCTNWVTVSQPLDASEGVRAFLRKLQRALLDAQESCFAPRRPASGPKAAPDAAFVHTKRLRPADYAFAGLQAEYTLNRRRRQWYGLEFHVTEYADRFAVDCSCRLSDHSAQAPEHLLSAFEGALAALVSGPADVRIADVLTAARSPLAHRVEHAGPPGGTPQVDEDFGIEEEIL
ncbi:non-ribosomal peptide synthetase/type I polyketide synthase [Trinickia terrae]|nr:non-ribosomal peptide synthetase/type I polyketide synthase [Trinickia terrae]